MPSVALVTIAKNESRSIGRLLESVKNKVDEIIVVDTGSSDGTIEIARSFGALVNTFNWIDDFSAARNFALSLTNAPWRLVLDADEWIDAGVADFNICRERPDFVGRVELRSTFNAQVNTNDSSKTLVSRTRLSRLLPRGVQYAGVVHESPQHSLPVRDVPLLVLHDGYEDEQLKRKGDRNILLLKHLVNQGNTDPYILYQFGKEQFRKRHYSTAADFFSQSREGLGESLSPWRESLICATLDSFSKARMVDRGLDLIDRETLTYLNSTMFWFSVGSFLMESAQQYPSLATKFFSPIENAFRRCLELGDADDVGESVIGTGSFLAVQNLRALYVATDGSWGSV